MKHRKIAQETTNQSKLTNLPFEMLLEILLYLDLKNIPAITLVSPLFYNLLYNTAVATRNTYKNEYFFNKFFKIRYPEANLAEISHEEYAMARREMASLKKEAERRAIQDYHGSEGIKLCYYTGRGWTGIDEQLVDRHIITPSERNILTQISFRGLLLDAACRIIENKKGNRSSFISAYLYLLEIHKAAPTSERTLRALGLVEYRLHRFESAEKWLKLALANVERDYNKLLILQDLGKTLWRLRRYQEAENHLRAAEEFYANYPGFDEPTELHPRTLLYLGIVYYHLKNFKEAKRYFDEYAEMPTEIASFAKPYIEKVDTALAAATEETP